MSMLVTRVSQPYRLAGWSSLIVLSLALMKASGAVQSTRRTIIIGAGMYSIHIHIYIIYTIEANMSVSRHPWGVDRALPHSDG